jgi:hypothetical protein
MKLNEHMNLLGHRVEDRVTGFKGIVSSVCFDLYGCIQATVNPGIGKDGKPQDSHWFDVNRLKITSKTPVMERPVFEWTNENMAGGMKGPAERAARIKP